MLPIFFIYEENLHNTTLPFNNHHVNSKMSHPTLFYFFLFIFIYSFIFSIVFYSILQAIAPHTSLLSPKKQPLLQTLLRFIVHFAISGIILLRENGSRLLAALFFSQNPAKRPSAFLHNQYIYEKPVSYNAPIFLFPARRRARAPHIMQRIHRSVPVQSWLQDCRSASTNLLYCSGRSTIAVIRCLCRRFAMAFTSAMAARMPEIIRSASLAG